MNKYNMKIRVLYKFLKFLIVVLFFASCHKKNVADAQLSVSSSEELFTADGGISDVAVLCNTTWSIGNSASWCTATSSTVNGNGKISLSVQSNTMASERSVIFSVAAGSIVRELKVCQLGKVNSATDSIKIIPGL